MTATLRIVLVDDHQLLRDAIRRGLESRGHLVIGEAADGHQAVAMVARLQPDVVLMDVSMPDLDGIDATRRILEADRRRRVLMLSMHVDPDVIRRALRAGAVGYLAKDADLDTVVEAVVAAADGDVALSPNLAALMLADAESDSPTLLSDREDEVLRLVAEGLSTPEIASRLFISQKTVKNHLASIYDKLDARDRTHAIIRAARLGIVKLGD